MGQTCYVLSCRCYRGENNVSVFWNVDDARIAMAEEMKVEIINLETGGYEYTKVVNEDDARLSAQDDDIYYNWEIEESTIR